MQMLITVTAPDGATGPSARAVGSSIVDQLKRSPNVAEVTSAWTAPPAAAERLVSKDGKTALVVAGISGGESDAQSYAQTLSDEVRAIIRPGDWHHRPVRRGRHGERADQLASCSAICC